MLGWNRYERGVNDLTAHRQVALFFQIAVKVLEQGINHAALRKQIALQPDRLGVGDFAIKTQAQKPHERKTVADLILHLIVGQIVERAQNDRLEHHHSIQGFATCR